MQIYVLLYDPSENHRALKLGTFLGSYEKVEVIEKQEKVNACEIKNELIPHSNHPRVSGERVTKSQSILDAKDWNHLSEEQKQALFQVIKDHDSLFMLTEKEIGKTETPPVHINVAHPTPVRGPKYRYPEKAKEIIAKLVQELEKKDDIEPSTAAWLSPIVLVSKPAGSKRLCLDYRGVNKHLATDIYPLPRLEELVTVALCNKFYATLGLKEPHFQMYLEESSRDDTTFSDGVSLYRYKRLPFGLNCSSAIFSRQMAQILAPLIKLGWLKNYLDDIINFGQDFNTLVVERLEVLFDLLIKKDSK